MSDIISEAIDEFIQEAENEVRDTLAEMGHTAVELNKQNGNYHNRTGKLRRSNYYEVKGNDTLTIGNKADYASKVSSRGYDVIDSGIQFLRKTLEGKS